MAFVQVALSGKRLLLSKIGCENREADEPIYHCEKKERII